MITLSITWNSAYSMGAYYPLSIGGVNRGAFGNNFGTNQHETILTAFFRVNTYAIADKEYLFSVNGYDIDTPDEVSISINGHKYGHLRVGENNSLNSGDAISIDKSHLLLGDNVIEFRRNKNADETWGVTNMYMSSSNEHRAPVVNLTIGEKDKGGYGKNFGSNEHVDYLVVTFENVGKNLQFKLIGHKIVSDEQIQVLLNDDLIGHLSADNKNDTSDVFEIENQDLFFGQNSIEFVNTTGQNWGVSNLLLTVESE